MLFFLSLEVKSIDFVLSSPMWIINLLSTNQSHVLEKSNLTVFQFHLYLHVDKPNMNHRPTETDEI